MTKVDLIRSLNYINLGQREDPTMWFEEISDLEVDYRGISHMIEQESKHALCCARKSIACHKPMDNEVPLYG